MREPGRILTENRGGFRSAGQGKIIQEKERKRVSENGTKFGRSVEKRGREGNVDLDEVWRRSEEKAPRRKPQG